MNIQQAILSLRENGQEPIAVMKFGSHVYGTNTETSDKDYKIVFLPSRDEILYGYIKETYTLNSKNGKNQGRNTKDDIDIEVISLKQYLKLLCQGQTMALDMLFTPNEFFLIKDFTWDCILINKEKFISKSIKPFIGYCKQQASKYGIKGSRVSTVRLVVELIGNLITLNGNQDKLKNHWETLINSLNGKEYVEFTEDYMRQNPEYKVRMLSVCDRKVQEHITLKEAYKIYKHVFDEYGQRALLAEKEEGIDWKALSHAIRVCDEAIELLQTGNIVFPLKRKDLILNIKNGKLPYKEVSSIIENGIEIHITK